MKYCPNPSCRHRLTAGEQAEYLDHALKCGDCGAALVAELGAFAEPIVSTTEDALGEHAESDDTANEQKARMDIITGVFVLIAGLAITWITYAFALNGGIYLIAWGPMVVGGIRLLRGLEQRDKNRDARRS